MASGINRTFVAALCLASLSLSACSTLGGVNDGLSRLNPFDKSEEELKAAQGEVAGDSERISLLSIDDTLQASDDFPQEALVLPQPYVNANWSQVGGNLQNVMQHVSAPGNLERVWSKDVGKGSFRKGRLVASPIIHNGKIFILDGKNTVSAYDAGTGSRLWQHRIEVTLAGKTREGRTGIFERVINPSSFADRGGKDNESVGGGIAADGNLIIATSGLGVVVAVDADTGAEIWRKRTTAPMHSSPAVSDGRVFAVSDDNELFAFDLSSGNVLWTYQGISETARMLTSPNPAVIDEVVIAPFTSGEIVAVRVQNGGVLWQDALTSSGRLTPLSTLNDIAAGPVIADGYVIASSQSGVMSALDLRTGQRIWTMPAGTIGFPWVAGDLVYAVTTDAEVICVSKITGAVAWVQKLQGFKNEKKRKDRVAWTGPVLAGGKIITVSSRGRMVEMDPFTGNILNERKVGDSVYLAPIVSNETLYILNDEAKLIALR